MKIRENQFLYTGTFFDTNEMLSCVKTFTGRIMDIQGTNIFSSQGNPGLGEDV